LETCQERNEQQQNEGTSHDASLGRSESGLSH
jgi:hypothetical protein